MTAMYGAFLRSGASAAPALQLIPSVYFTEGAVTAAQAFFTLLSSGIASGGDIVDSGDGNYNWLINGSASNYEVRATLTAGTFTTGTAGSWVSLASTVGWTVRRTTIGGKSATATFEIRPAGGGATIVSASITIQALVTP